MHPDTEQILNRIVDDEISDTLENLMEAVTNLRDSVEDTLKDPTGTYNINNQAKTLQPPKACCSINEQELDNDRDFLGKPVDKWSVCLLGRGLTLPGTTFLKNEKLLSAMNRNKEIIPQIKWQYTGFEWNYAINYPATKSLCLPDYDPVLP